MNELVPTDRPTRASLRVALEYRGITTQTGAFDDAILDAVTQIGVHIDSVEYCAALLGELGARTIVGAFQNGTDFDAVSRRAAAVRVTDEAPHDVGDNGSGNAAANSSGWTVAARHVLHCLHLSAGFAPLSAIRSAAEPSLDSDAALAELVGAGIITVTHPDASSASIGKQVSLRLSRLWVCVAEFQCWASEHPDDVATVAGALDDWILAELNDRSVQWSGARAIELRRPGILAVERLASAGAGEAAVAVAEVLGPILADAGVHRTLHRRLQSVHVESPSVADRLRVLSARLYLATGDAAMCRYLLKAGDAPKALVWQADTVAVVWAAHVDIESLLGRIDEFARSGGDREAAAGVALEVLMRVVTDAGHGVVHCTVVDEVFDVCGTLVAQVGLNLPIARLRVLDAIRHAHRGETLTGRRLLASAHASAGDDHTFVHIVMSCVTPAFATFGVTDASHVAPVLDALTGATGFTLDRAAIHGPLVADCGIRRLGTPDAGSGVRRPGTSMLDAVSLLCGYEAGEMTAPRPGRTPPQRAGSNRATVGPADCTRLTARESQIANLVAAGLTNVDIGARLDISRWTVVSHLRNIMRKWDCTSRVVVAVHAREGTRLVSAEK